MGEELLSIKNNHTVLPVNYIRPESDRPRLHDVQTAENVPVIDLSCLDKSSLRNQVAEACQSYGFFQVVNHGVSNELVSRMMTVSGEFFRLSKEEKMSLYSDDPAKKMRLSTSFNVQKETYRNWRDYLRLHCYPLEEFVPDWPSNPPLFNMTGAMIPFPTEPFDLDDDLDEGIEYSIDEIVPSHLFDHPGEIHVYGGDIDLSVDLPNLFSE